MAMPTEDPQLARLYDYTKFHIGIYLLAAGAMVTIAGSETPSSFVEGVAEHPWLLMAAILAMAVAGLAGGVIASTCATAEKLSDVWDECIGPWNRGWMPGSFWARLEHSTFWLSAGLLTAAALWSK